jgi:hypothetical protein
VVTVSPQEAAVGSSQSLPTTCAPETLSSTLPRAFITTVVVLAGGAKVTGIASTSHFVTSDSFSKATLKTGGLDKAQGVSGKYRVPPNIPGIPWEILRREARRKTLVYSLDLARRDAGVSDFVWTKRGERGVIPEGAVFISYETECRLLVWWLFRLKGYQAGATEEKRVRFCPGVQSALRAGVFGLALPLLLADGVVFAASIMVEDGGVIEQELFDHAAVASVRINQVGHFLSGFLAACLAGGGGDQADLAHFGCPLSVMVAFAWGCAVVVLPEVAHFVCQGGQDFIRGTGGEQGRVEGDFIGDQVGVGAADKPFTGEVAVRAFVPLHGDEAGWQAVAKEFAVEGVIGNRETAVGLGRGVDHGVFLHAQYFVSYDAIIRSRINYVKFLEAKGGSLMVVSFETTIFVWTKTGGREDYELLSAALFFRAC